MFSTLVECFIPFINPGSNRSDESKGGPVHNTKGSGVGGWTAGTALSILILGSMERWVVGHLWIQAALLWGKIYL